MLLLEHCFLCDLLLELGEDRMDDELELDKELDDRGGVGGDEEHELLLEY